MTIDINPGQSSIIFEYSTIHMSKFDAARLVRSFTKIIDHIITTPQIQIKDFHIVSQEDIDRQETSLQAPTKRTTHEMIYDQIIDRPSDKALIAWDGTLTFGELGLLSTRLALALQKYGSIGPGSYVAFCFSKSLWAAVTILAIQKIGAAFVPLDPNAPVERWRQIMSTMKLKTAVVSHVHASAFQDVAEVVVPIDQSFLLDDSGEAAELLQSSTRFGKVSPEDPSFIIFTSGSTGNPKGIVMEHQTMCSMSKAHPAHTGVGPGTRVFNFSAYTFDAGIMDILLTWIRGGCVCIPSEHDRVNDLPGAITKMQANWIFLTPTMADVLAPDIVPTLKTLFVGGEVITRKLADKWKHDVRLIGAYGPTEVAICAANDRLGFTRNPTSLGQPLRSLFWIVDPSDTRRLVPDGCVGELIIQGPLLARGYTSTEPSVTKVWITDASRLPEGIPTAKAYLTGDLVKKTTDGSFEFIGRKDSQVKIRGQRTELGEIETQLTRLLPASVRGIVEFLKDETTGSGTLSVLIWYHDGAPGTIESNEVELAASLTRGESSMISMLDESLKALLPSYMIPSLFLFFRGSPDQTISGKINRRQLKRLAETATIDERRIFAPRADLRYEPVTTSMELHLRELWAAVLQIEASFMGKRANFLGLGGDSIAAIKLVGHAHTVGIQLSVALVFQHSILADMAAACRKIDQGPTQEEDIAPFSLLPANITSEDITSLTWEQCKHGWEKQRSEFCIEDVYPCTSIQTGIMAASIKCPGSYIGRFIYRIGEHVDKPRLISAWEETIRACGILRTRFVLLDEIISSQAILKEDVYWDTIASMSLDSVRKQFDKVNMGYGERLCRYAITRDGYFVLMLHHSIYDGFTLVNILDALQESYESRQPLAPRKYGQVIQYLTRQDNEASKEYWTKELANAKPNTFPPLPVDYSRSNFDEESTLTWKGTVFPRRRADKPSSITIASIIKTAWAIVLSKWCNSDDICFGMTVSGRTAPILNANEVAFPLITTIPVRVKLRANQEISKVLEKIQSKAIEVIPFEQFGLRNISNLNSEAAACCKFSSLLVLQTEEIMDLGSMSEKRIIVTQTTEETEYCDYPLVLQAVIRSETVDFIFMYDSSLVQESQCIAIFQHFENLIPQLEQISQNDGNRTLGDLSVEASSELVEEAQKKQEIRRDSLGTRSTSSILDKLLQHGEHIIDPKELTLASLWGLILGTDPKSLKRHDSFMHIGGDSVSAIQLSALAKKRQLYISVTDILKQPKLSAMANAASWISPETPHECDHSAPPQFSLLNIPSEVQSTVKSLELMCKLNSDQKIEDAYPTTPLQEGLLALSVKHPGSYIAKHVYRLSSHVDLARFKNAWQKVYNTCENLRTRIVQYEGASLQILVDEDFAWERTEHMDLHEYLQTLRDLEMSYNDRLTRFAIVSEPSGIHYFVLVMHHAQFDGWTLMLNLNMLSEAYHNRKITSLAPYSNFVKYVSELDLEHSRDYWSDQLKGVRPAEFPPLSAVAQGCQDRSTMLLSRTFEFPQMAKTSITKATVLKAAWAFVLARYNNGDDITFGVTAAGRNANVAAIDRMAGTVIGTMPVRVRIDKGQKVSDFFYAIQHQALEMIPHEQTGFQNIARINEDTKQACDVSTLMIIQSERHMSLMKAAADELMIPATEEEYPLEKALDGYYTFSLVNQCSISENFVTVQFTYDANIIPRHRMEALGQHFETTVNNLVLNQDCLLQSVNITGSWDVNMAIHCNQSMKESVVHSVLYDSISKAALEHPEHEAIYCTEMSLTYGELESLSENFAAYLIMSFDVTIGTVVPICLEKSAWTIVAMIGVMKAGGVFVPLDTSHPESRLRALLEQVSAQMLITSPQFASKCTRLSEVVIEISPQLFKSMEDNNSPKSPRQVPSWVCPTATDLAYILFTSGSTGKPKAIMMEHGAICSSVLSHGRSFELSISSRMLQFASYAFDICLSEIFATLSYGGTVCIPSEVERMQNFVAFMESARVNFAMLTPSFTTTFMPSDVPYLGTLILTGEPPNKATLAKWVSHVRLLNAYAPAECGIYALMHTYESDNEFPAMLGHGLHHNLWIAEPDDYNRLAPFGCTGELLLQGNVIGRGYVNDSQETARAFLASAGCIPNSHQDPRFRLYKTGDLVRYNAKGQIEYLGRKDTQVKLRGQRIELGEVEYNVSIALPEAAYVTAEVVRRAQSEALIAFFSYKTMPDEYLARSPAIVDGDSLILRSNKSMKQRIRSIIAEMKSKYPAYMVPNLIVPLRETPFLPSLKVDRKRLRALVQLLPSEHYLALLASEFSEKKIVVTDSERKLRSLWAECLRSDEDQIGRDDNFFESGGDSITAIKLANLANSKGFELNVGAIFQDPRLSAMAATFTSSTSPDHQSQADAPFALAGDDQQNLDEVRRLCNLEVSDVIEDLYPCTPLQEGLLSLSVKHPASYVTRHIFRLGKMIDVESFKKAWSETVRVSTNLRTRIVLLNGQSMQVVIRGGIEWEVISDLDIDEYLSSLTSPASRFNKIEITYGSSLTRYTIVAGKYFVLTAHHAIFDGWSIRINLDTLHKIYHYSEIPAAVPFSRFIRYVKNLNSHHAREYWERELQGAHQACFPDARLATQTRDETLKYRNSFDIKPSYQSSLTKASILRGAWALLLARYCLTEDICFGATVSGRHAPVQSLDLIAGPCIATIPVRIKIDRKESVSKFLHRVQLQGHQMVAYEQYGLQNIAKVSQSAAAATRFTSIFVVQPEDFARVAENDDDAVLLDPGDNIEDPFDGNQTYPLVVQAITQQSRIQIEIIYNPNIVSESKVKAIFNHFQHIVHQLLSVESDADCLVSEVSISSAWDADLAISWNQQNLAPVNSLLHELVTSCAKENFNKEAIYSTGWSLSYADLDKLSSKLAFHLLYLGVTVESVVPFCFEKSPWATIAMLGILKAGGTFMPLDPTHPASYRAKLISQVGAKLVLVSTDTAEKCQDLPVSVVTVSSLAPFMQLGDPTSMIEVDRIIARTPKPQPESSAYIIFTSGSTGTPKGIKISHKNICTSLIGHADRLGFSQNARAMSFSSYVFDVSISDIFATIITGGTICLANEMERLQDLAGFLTSSRATIAALTPSMIRTIHPEQVPTLKTIIATGEAMTSEIVDTWAEQLTLINAYGPAEATIYATSHIYSSRSEHPHLIGSGMKASVWVVEPHDPHSLAPLGCTGELVLQSHAVAEGYVSNPGETALSFSTTLSTLPNNIVEQAPYFYRTGDLVRYDELGRLIFLGRRDNQVKLRGQRLELNSIENEIQHVSQLVYFSVASVITRPEGDVLVAFVGFKGARGTNHDRRNDESLLHDIAMKLTEALPQYMVPTHLIPLEEVPRTSSDKIDRRLLKNMAQEMSSNEFTSYAVSSQVAFRGCSNPTESLLRKMWSDVLGLEEDNISVDDNFYSLGGDSIRIVSLMKTVHDKFNKMLPYTIYNSRKSTISIMAQYVESSTHTMPALDLEGEIRAITSSSWLETTSSFIWNTLMPEMSTVFLTGATGMLGSEILRQLLLMPLVGRVITLVRAPTSDQGLERLKESATTAGWLSKIDSSGLFTKVIVWVGDLGLVDLGLSPPQWDSLCGKPSIWGNVDGIIHNGASVNWNADFDKLKASNVDSTISLLKASMESSVPTKMVFVSGGAKVDLYADREENLNAFSEDTGYSQSKFVAESVLHNVTSRAREVQNRFSTLKPGIVLGTRTHGVPNLDDFIWRLVQTAEELNSYPLDTPNSWIPMCEADSVAKSIIDQLFEEKISSYVDLEIGLASDKFWEAVNNSLHRQCKPLNWSKWIERASERINIVGESHRLWPVQHFLGEFGMNGCLQQDSVTSELLVESIQKNIQYLQRIGALKSSKPKRLAPTTIGRAFKRQRNM